MTIANRIGLASAWLVGLALIGIAINKNDPYFVVLRGPGNLLLVSASLLAVMVLVRSGSWRRGRAGKALVLLWLLPSLSMLGATISFEARKRNVLQTEPALAHTLGRHFLVGYSSLAEIARLAETGLIGGVYITRHNVAGRRAEDIREEIAGLQERRRIAGLPPLIVAADQEGGIVSHLSQPLQAVPALSTLAGLPTDIRTGKAEDFGRIHGRELAGVGVNLNLAPVLDLRPDIGYDPFDRHTLINQRAISNDPAIVSEIAAAYVRGLEAFGVSATLKHFPGLGRVRADTHLFSASLDAPLADLEVSDWRPFRELLAGSKAQLMIGHVNVSAIDPDRPASHSKLVIDGLIRKRWNYQGVILTDDFVMGAIYKHDACRAVVEALNAGADMVVVAYDGAQFYRFFACASDATQRGELDMAMLGQSEKRLRRSFPNAHGDALVESASGTAQPAL